MAYTATGLVLDLKTGLPVTSRPTVRLYELTGTGTLKTPVSTAQADQYGRVTFSSLTNGKLYTAYAPTTDGFAPVALTPGGLSATLLAPGSNSTVLQTSSGGTVQWATVTDAMLAGSISATKLTAGAVSTLLNTSAAGTQNWGKLTSAMLSGDYNFPGDINGAGRIVSIRAAGSRFEMDGGVTGNRDGGFLTFGGYFDGTNWVNVGTSRAAQIFLNDATTTTQIAVSLRYGTGTTASSFSSYGDGLMVSSGGVVWIGGFPAASAVAGDLVVMRAASPTTGVHYFGNSAGLVYIYYDGSGFTFRNSGGYSATLSTVGVWTNASAEFSDADPMDPGKGRVRQKELLNELTRTEASTMLRAVRPLVYKHSRLSDQPQDIGFFAEELHAVSPFLSDGKGVSPMPLIALLVKTVQDLMQRVETLEQGIIKK